MQYPALLTGQPLNITKNVTGPAKARHITHVHKKVHFLVPMYDKQLL